MNFFTAQKHAAFSAKLFAAAGFDFAKAYDANDEQALKAHLTAATPAAVNALFTSAGLNLETLLAAGPDSLKAHLASLDNAAQIATLTTDLAAAKADHEAITKTLAVRDNTLSAFAETFAAIGLANITNKTPAVEVKTAFETHVAKQVTLANAKAGHPPVHHIDPDAAAATAAASDEAVAKEYSAMPAGPARLAFYSKNAAALQRVYDAQNRRDDSA